MSTKAILASVVAAVAFFSMAKVAIAADASAAVAPVRQFMDAFSRGDTVTMLAACAPSSSVIDDFAPHVWHGPTGCADWWHAYSAYAKAQDITSGSVRLGAPSHVMIDGDTAYVVIPATFVYMQHGKRQVESGSTLTAALREYRRGWLITGWAWSGS